MYNNKLNAKQLTENMLHVETEQQPVVLLRVSQREPYPGVCVCVCFSFELHVRCLLWSSVTVSLMKITVLL